MLTINKMRGLGRSVWYREASRLWWKSRRYKGTPYQAVFERESWRLLFIDAGVLSRFTAKPRWRWAVPKKSM